MKHRRPKKKPSPPRCKQCKRRYVVTFMGQWEHLKRHHPLHLTLRAINAFKDERIPPVVKAWLTAEMLEMVIMGKES